MLQFENIIYEEVEGISSITINRPKARNALNRQARRELKEVLRKVSEDQNIKVVVIKGAEETFCAGADVSELEGLTSVEARKFFEEYGTVVLGGMIRSMKQPVIAAVDGFALGAGFELALATDIIIASEAAEFGLPEIRVGLIPGGGGTQHLTRLVKEKKAKELMFTGDRITAKDAERLGIVNKVVPRDKLQEEASEFAKKLSRRSPLLLDFVKKAVNRSSETTLSEGLRYELELITSVFASEDHREGIRAFLEKRAPIWKGR